MSFIEKLFISNEIKYFELKGLKVNVIVGNFLVKEVISKVIGIGFRGFGLKDIEVFRDELGKFVVKLSDKIYELLDLKDINIYISILYSKDNVIVYVIMEVI